MRPGPASLPRADRALLRDQPRHLLLHGVHGLLGRHLAVHKKNPRWTSSFAGSTVTVRGDVKMDTQQIVEAFRRLPPDERVRLVEELWDEVARELEQKPLSEAQQRLLDERIRQHEENPADVEAWEAARDDLLRDL
jgi:putative addiction module component (TIGR02574 family)